MIVVKHVVVAEIPLLEMVESDIDHQKLPTVLFYHGWGSCKESAMVNGYELAKQGFRAVLPEAYLHGERKEGTLNEEAYMEFWHVVAHSIKEFPTLTDYYISKGLTDPDRIGVTGLSMGGITTCALLTHYPSIKTAVCLMGSPAPVLFSRWLLNSSWAEGLNIDEANYQAELEQLKPIDLSLQPEKIAGRYLHFWHGTSDNTVPYQPTLDFYERVINEQPEAAKHVSFTSTKGAGHKVPYESSVEMATFFAKHL